MSNLEETVHTRTNQNTIRNVSSIHTSKKTRFILVGVIIGSLIAGIGLATVLTMYIDDQSKKTLPQPAQVHHQVLQQQVPVLQQVLPQLVQVQVHRRALHPPVLQRQHHLHLFLIFSGRLTQILMICTMSTMHCHSFTWEMWSYPINLDNYDNLMLGMCETTTQNKCMYLMIRTNCTYFAFFNNDCHGSTVVLTNRWYHIAFVYDYVTLTQYIYLNGVLECTHSSSAPFQATNGAMTIGAINNTGTSPAAFWTGYIDQMSYVSRAKNATEILTDATLVAYYSFDNGSFYDLGPNQIIGAGVNVVATTGRVGQSLLLNDSSAYFQAGGFTLLGVWGQPYSISLWVNKPPSTSPGGTLVHVSGSSNGTLWCIPMLGPVLQAGVWNHIVTSYSMTNGVRLWINGTLMGSSPTFTYAASSSPNWITVGTTFPAAMSCAHGSVSVGQFYGMIDELRVYSRELTASDVSALANA
ncbi:hypothetical protein I4U23_015792 [Adineta vaga]|nr:hypothetical protein I4U23_015792 [Adineta vaga]